MLVKSYVFALFQNLEWKREPDVKMAAQMFRNYKLKDADQKPTLVLTLDLHNTEEERERAIISFYKQTNVDWTRPFEVCLKGTYSYFWLRATGYVHCICIASKSSNCM